MKEKILVFKGALVAYRSWLRWILCRDFGFSCFVILDVDPRMVEAGENAKTWIYSEKCKDILGDELWSDGEKYIIDSGQG
jgi:hypothetical protein